MIATELLARTAESLARIRAARPLVHNITNYVVMNSTANVLLALGASPVMAHAVEEVEEMVGIAGALVLNIGTLSPAWIEAMHRAGKAARRAGIPTILDPVGAGATRLRTRTARELLAEVAPAVVRGNASEIMALVDAGARTRGVDSSRAGEDACAAALEIARAHGCVVAITGVVDHVTDGRGWLHVSNGHALMSRVTGTGCAATAVIGAFCAVERDPFAAAAGGLVVFGIAGALAAFGDPRPGTYATRLIDALDEISPEHVVTLGRVAEESPG
ncbi:MAG: hydroxyethylthiazole kinase [Thermoanaerobaculaceae bacterium]|jgi:hydroxyethylthiazole kinase